MGVAGRNDLPSISLLELKAMEAGPWIWVESDSSTALSWALNKGNKPWSAIRLLRSISQGLLSLNEWSFTHIHREGNAPADILAAFQSICGESLIPPSGTWQELRQALELDRLGTIH
ncbi:hypothetical protein QJS04_geneDACA021167 [Acorus gramineus]|uniref:RNase H type-1 domain-containing protein n=1 Tax=Acorus gramineus TaxID=55184 RepID=A0AAV9AD67_ACOGR|nr:hypothetical protein QJS04_geneDACA021167 [Acorus gramineus]